jgi:hypothetical protein
LVITFALRMTGRGAQALFDFSPVAQRLSRLSIADSGKALERFPYIFPHHVCRSANPTALFIFRQLLKQLQ